MTPTNFRNFIFSNKAPHKKNKECELNHHIKENPENKKRILIENIKIESDNVKCYNELSKECDKI